MSEQGFSRNVEQGTSANISAPAWNKVTSYVDEVANGTSRTLRVTPQTKTPSPEGRLVSLVKADEDIETGDFLSMTGVNIDSTQNDQYFKYHGVPTVEKMGGSPKSICVAMQPIKSGKYGRACITGICVAKINSPTAATYDFYDADGSTTAGTAPLTNDDTGLRVIWSDGTSGDSLALVAVNLAGGGGGEPGSVETLVGEVKTTTALSGTGLQAVTVTVDECTDAALVNTDVTVYFWGQYPMVAGMGVTALKSTMNNGTSDSTKWLAVDFQVIEVTPP